VCVERERDRDREYDRVYVCVEREREKERARECVCVCVCVCERVIGVCCVCGGGERGGGVLCMYATLYLSHLNESSHTNLWATSHIYGRSSVAVSQCCDCVCVCAHVCLCVCVRVCVCGENLLSEGDARNPNESCHIFE